MNAASQAYTDATSAAAKAAAASPTLDSLSQGISNITSSGSNALDFAKANWKPAMAAALPVLQGIQSNTTTKLPTGTQSPQYITPYSYDPRTHSLTSLGDYQANTSGSGPGYTRLAEGGITHFDDGGDVMSGPSLDAYRYLMGQSNSPTRGGLSALAQQGQFSNWQPQVSAANGVVGGGSETGGNAVNNSAGFTVGNTVDINPPSPGEDAVFQTDPNSYTGGILNRIIGSKEPAPVEDAVPSVVNDPSVLTTMVPPSSTTEPTPTSNTQPSDIASIISNSPVVQASNPSATETPYTAPPPAPDIASIISNSPVVEQSRTDPYTAPVDIASVIAQSPVVQESHTNPYEAPAAIADIVSSSPVVQASQSISTPQIDTQSPEAIAAQIQGDALNAAAPDQFNQSYFDQPQFSGGVAPWNNNGMGSNSSFEYGGGGGGGGTLYRGAIEEYAHGGLSAGASHASALRGPLTSLHGVEHLMQYAHGGSTPYSDGQYNLGGYSDGGRLLRGPGDGVSDSIPATIANKQPARLADGEFVVPARIVSELGNGSTEAGARKLYAMMDRIQKARSKTVGKDRVAVNNKADKYLPA
jgi:hypothetical protein